MRPEKRRGISLVEVIVATALSAIVMAMMWRGVRFFQSTMALQMRLERMSQALDVTQEISQAVESARRVISVGPDHLDLEVYNFGAYDLLDPRLYQRTKRVRYEYESDPPALVRDVYASTEAAKPEHSKRFLSSAGLAAPQDAEPYFQASYLVAQTTVGVRVALRLSPPFSTEEWTPVKKEVYVRAN